ncbi:MAG: PEP-CTERM sorting domain-containing protein [Tepidisphaeraceae bacterium]
MEQDGSNVVATGSGTLDTAALTGEPELNLIAYALPQKGIVVVGSASSTAVKPFSAPIGPSNFGTGSEIEATSGSGDSVGESAFTDVLYLPVGYVSGDALSDSSTFANSTLASLGVTPGSYAWTWGSGSTADSFRLDISNGPAPLFSLASSIPNSGTDEAPAFGAADPGNSDIVQVSGSSPDTASWSPSGPSNKVGYFDFNGIPQGDDVEVGLKFTTPLNDGVVSAAEVTEIVDYINANDGGAGDIASAYSSAPAGVTSELGAGDYDVLLSDVAGANDPYALYDFSNFSDDYYLGVTNVGVDYLPVSVPEPGSISLLALGGLGLLARRRRSPRGCR